MATKKKLISIVIPAYNEQENIAELTKQLANTFSSTSTYKFETIIVENASTDNTMKLLAQQRKKYSWLKIVQLAKNVGCDGAIVAGLSFAKGDAAIVMMADLQENPNLIPLFIRKWEEGYDVVYGVVKNRGRIKFYKKFGAAIYYKLISTITKNLVLKDVSDFRLMDKKVYTVVSQLPEHNKFFRGIVSWTGFRQTGIDIKREDRFAGESKADLRTLFFVAFNGITSFSYLPLRVGWLIWPAAFIGMLATLVTRQYLLSLLLLLFSILFFQLGILSEYLIKVIDETRQRPNFIVKDKIGF